MNYVSCLMKDNTSKFPSKYSFRKSLQVCSSMLSLFSDKFKIHITYQQGIKNLLLKTNNKINSAISNSVKNSYGYCKQVLDQYITARSSISTEKTKYKHRMQVSIFKSSKLLIHIFHHTNIKSSCYWLFK